MSFKPVKPTDSRAAVATSGPTAPVPKDPQPSVDRIDELARRILTGDILLPKFQRRFVWDRGQILVLLDSVARGFPIGSVLLWQSTQELRSENRIADLEIDLPRPGYPVNYLLDGQQRLSSMCGAIYWNGTSNPSSRWNIAYDLRTQQFLHFETLDEPPLHQIRVNKLADPAIFFKHVALLDNSSLPDKLILKQRADAFFNRFKDYKIATVTLGDMSIQDVAPIFERVNSTGTPLTIVDLMRAATWSPEFDLIDSIEGILENLAEKGYGKIDKKVILRNISAAAGGGFSADSIDALRRHAATRLKQAVEDTHEAYKRAVDFLTTPICIPTSELVPYSNQITVLGEIFRMVPTPTAAQYRSISQWFWKSALSGYFSGWNTGMMATDLAAVQSFAAGGSSIQLNVPKPNADIWQVRTFRANNAHAKLLAIILAHHQPIDLLTGQRIDTAKALAWTNEKEYHHFFPQEYLANRGEKVNRINALANIIMLSSASNKAISAKAPSVYLKEVVKASGDQLEKWLVSNLISREAFEAALRDDYDSFLTLRATTIHSAILQKTDWT
jgi:hypothetical protein